MKKNDGFTLIELIAVITLLAVIILVSVPVIINTLRKAEQKEYDEFKKLIASAAELYLERNRDLYPEFDEIGDSIDINADMLIDEGYLKNDLTDPIDNNPVSKYKVSVIYGQDEIFEYKTIERKTFSELVTTTSEVTSINNCAYSGSCKSGTKFAIEVNDTEIYNFYVINDEENEVTLIMDRNLGDTVAWYADARDNSYGPITAINYLDELTDEEWSNIQKKSYTYSGIGHDGTTKKYEDITKTMRARMLTYNEAMEVFYNGKMPDWLYGNLYTNKSLPYGYWTSTAAASDSRNAWCAYFTGDLYTNFGVGYDNSYIGVRPVITISRSL